MNLSFDIYRVNDISFNSRAGCIDLDVPDYESDVIFEAISKNIIK